MYAIVGGKEKEEDNGSKVIMSVKRQLLNAKRSHQVKNYSMAERACHNALSLLVNSEHANQQSFVEARARTMDEVIISTSTLYLFLDSLCLLVILFVFEKDGIFL